MKKIASLILTSCLFSISFCYHIQKKTPVEHIGKKRDTIITKTISTGTGDSARLFFPLKKDTSIYGNQTIYPFKDTTYRLYYHVLKEDPHNEDEKNTVFTFMHQATLIFRDSLYSMHNHIQFMDMNNDKVKDIMVFHYTGARANPTYHLYLRDTIDHKLIPVKGFEKLPNPILDPANNIISSGALYADKVWTEFYRINQYHKLVPLGHAFEDDMRDDNNKYDEAIKAIMKRYGRGKSTRP